MNSKRHLVQPNIIWVMGHFPIRCNCLLIKRTQADERCWAGLRRLGDLFLFRICMYSGDSSRRVWTIVSTLRILTYNVLAFYQICRRRADIFRIYCADHTYVTLKLRMDAAVDEVVSHAAAKMCLGEDLVLCEVKSNGGESVNEQVTPSSDVERNKKKAISRICDIFMRHSRPPEWCGSTDQTWRQAVELSRGEFGLSSSGGGRTLNLSGGRPPTSAGFCSSCS